MPEGDTLHRAAARIRPVLEGRRLETFWARKLRGLRPRPGQRIEAVRAEGKHLLVEFDRELSLDVHLGMTGWWRAYGEGSDPARALRSPKLRVHLSTDAGHALCFAAPTVQTFLRTAEVTPLTHLGVDLTLGDPDVSEVVARARARHPASAEIHDVLLDQGIAAGIGNIWKSETLFHERLWPFTLLGDVDDDRLVRLYLRASELLAASVRTPARMYVYDRWRLPCRLCSTPIRRDYRGRTARSTYWCPGCQPTPSEPEGL